MARNKKQKDSTFADLVARLNKLSNFSPEKERNSLMEAASAEPQILDNKDVSLADIAKLAGIKEFEQPVSISKDAEKLVDRITHEDKDEQSEKSSITKAIEESDADDSISTTIKKTVTEEDKRLTKIAELEQQLAELKAEEKEEATLDIEGFKFKFIEDVTEYVKEAEGEDLVELYNRFSNNQVDMNEDSFVISTPETKDVIADAEKAEQPEEEVVVEKDKDEEKDNKEEDDDTGEVPMLDKEFDDQPRQKGQRLDVGEAPVEKEDVKFSNDLSEQK